MIQLIVALIIVLFLFNAKIEKINKELLVLRSKILITELRVVEPGEEITLSGGLYDLSKGIHKSVLKQGDGK